MATWHKEMPAIQCIPTSKHVPTCHIYGSLVAGAWTGFVARSCLGNNQICPLDVDFPLHMMPNGLTPHEYHEYHELDVHVQNMSTSYNELRLYNILQPKLNMFETKETQTCPKADLAFAKQPCVRQGRRKLLRGHPKILSLQIKTWHRARTALRCRRKSPYQISEIR